MRPVKETIEKTRLTIVHPPRKNLPRRAGAHGRAKTRLNRIDGAQPKNSTEENGVKQFSVTATGRNPPRKLAA
jgi:hypothetical protein